jgi:hypothetical protein
MNLLLRDLIDFEEVEEVIKLRKDEKAREYVEKYVISKSLHDNLLHMFEVLTGSTHKSFNIVGNYGTGKSHFLAFVAALLEHPELRSLILDPDVRAAAEKLNRRFLVVKFELGAAQDVTLRYIFFDQIQRQLLDRYDIEVRKIDLSSAYDNKQNVEDILKDIKSEDAEAGLVVIVDEISDFLKQKTKEGMAHDIALLRELGEVSQDSDFLYIGAMQEHVFTNLKYVDQAESIARVNQRFVTITITKDDVAQVLTNRVVRKDDDQRLQLQGLLEDHRKFFPNLANQTDRYIDLFPVHPYVIDVFERLPYFENRGIIGFTVQNVKPLLEQPAPVFITFDRIFDLINATHEIRNQPAVSKVIDVVSTLQTKADLLDARYRGDAQKLIKSLGVLKLLGGDKDLGATSQELANTLFITPPGRLIVEASMANDHIERVMKNIRDVTVGQYIDYAEGRYSLNLTKIEDYDALIEQKAQAAVIGNDEEINRAYQEFVAGELGLHNETPLLPGKYVYPDTSPWNSRKSFRTGLFVIGRPEDGANLLQGDYRFVLQGPLTGKSLNQQNELILGADFTDEMIGLLVRARAAILLAQARVHPKVMTDLAKKAYSNFRDKYLAQLVENGYALHRGHRSELKKLPAQRSLSALVDIIDHVKGSLLDDLYKDKYPDYPVLRTLITAANIESEVTRALQSLDRLASQQMDFNSRSYLESFSAIVDGQFSASASPACSLILKRIEENDKLSKVTPVEDLLREFTQAPWGLQEQMTYLLIGSLLFHGYILLIQAGGKRLNASDVSPLLKNGLEFFKNIKYLERDKDIDVEAVAGIFTVLGLQAGLVRNKDTRSEAVKELRLRGADLKQQLSNLRQDMNNVVAGAANYSDLPWLAVQQVQSRLDWLTAPLSTFSEASRVTDLGKLDTTPEFRQALKDRLADLELLSSFVQDWKSGIDRDLRRMQEAVSGLAHLEAIANQQEKQIITELRNLSDDSHAIYTDEKQFLRSDLRRPLKGKLEQFRGKYNTLYYNMHLRLAGSGAPWEQLSDLRKQSRYQALNLLKGLPFISPAEFNQLALEIQSLERLQCLDFNAQVLDNFVICPYCHLPEDGERLVQLPHHMGTLQSKMDELWHSWETQIFNELAGLAERIPLLSPAHQREIKALQAAGSLPDPLGKDLIDALFELSSELQPIEIELNELMQFLVTRGNALTEAEFRTGIDEFLAIRLKGYQRDLVRIKMVMNSDNLSNIPGRP